MGIFDDIFERNGKILINSWIEWKHISTGLVHCHICFALDKCWFNKSIMPILPLHEKCHCIANKIATPTERIVSADCPIEKLTKDIFSKERNEVTGKKDLFEMWGYTIINSLELKRELEKQARMNYSLSEYFLGKLDSHGQRIDVRIKLNRGGEEYVFKSAWMVGKKGKIKCITVYGGK